MTCHVSSEPCVTTRCGPGATARRVSGHTLDPLPPTWPPAATDRARLARGASPSPVPDPPDGRPGLDEYYWLADQDVDPDLWPVLARNEALAEWVRFDMAASEVVYSVIADPEFKPFAVTDPPRWPFCLPAGQDISAEECALTTRPGHMIPRG